MAITTKVETITPAKAKAYLEGNKKNRKVRRSVVDKYARMMESGQWRLTHQGIGFNGDGSLKDGQHRLLAIIQSGKTVKMNVTRGLEKDAMIGVDTGKNRDLVDVATIAGVDIEITRTYVAVTRVMIDSMSRLTYRRSSEWSYDDLIAFIREHYAAIEFASNADLGTSSNAAVRAVLARAYYTADRGLLEEFVSILSTGVSKAQAGMWAVKLRELVLTFRNPGGGWASRRSMYAKAERALTKFLDGAPFTILREAITECFLLPGEAQTQSPEDDD